MTVEEYNKAIEATELQIKVLLQDPQLRDPKAIDRFISKQGGNKYLNSVYQEWMSLIKFKSHLQTQKQKLETRQKNKMKKQLKGG